MTATRKGIHSGSILVSKMSLLDSLLISISGIFQNLILCSPKVRLESILKEGKPHFAYSFLFILTLIN